jgi:glycosyltransferase 2 family protein
VAELLGRRREPARRLTAPAVVGALVSLVSVVAVVWWISKQDAPQLPDSATGYAWLALASAVIAVNFTLRGWRWHLIMRFAALPHRRRDALGLTLVGYMGNNVLPARGGEVLKIGLLGQRAGVSRRGVLGTVVVERALDVAVLAVMFAVLTWAGVRGSAGGPAGAAVAAAGIAAAAVALFVYERLRQTGKFERFAALVRPVAGALKLLARPQGIPPALLSGLIWCLDGVTFMLIARSVGIELSPFDALGVVVLASLAAAIPAAPGYVGTFDAAMLVGLHAAGVEGGDAVAVLLLARFLFFVPVTIAGLITLVAGYGGFQTRRRVNMTWNGSARRMSASRSANISDQRSRT